MHSFGLGERSLSSALIYEEEKKIPSPFDFGHKKAIILSGPTGTGKTELSLFLAKALGGEIISADSMQVYKEMDIGTAKATLEEREMIPHHLIDICGIDTHFNVVEFYHKATQAMASIFARDKVPIIVGGTGFYLHTLLYGPPQGPPSNENVRKAVEADMDRFGPELLYEKVKECDPVYGASISPQDKHKIIRALEIMAISHKKVSDFSFGMEKLAHPEINFRCWFIYYPKEILNERIDRRCDEMIKSGLLEEVKELEKKGLRHHMSASVAIGYKQALDYLSSMQTQQDFEEFKAQFKRASKKYAKRQFTWFRKEQAFRWLDLEHFSKEKAAELILHDFENSL